MKMAILLLAALATCGGTSWAQGSFQIFSPDHPRVWYNRSGDKVEQRLYWNEKKQLLEVEVTYDEIPSVLLRDQFYYDNFKLSFPTIQLDRTGNLFINRGRRGRDVVIGSFRADLLGRQVVLEPGVSCSTFRRNGVVNAVIEFGRGAQLVSDPEL